MKAFLWCVLAAGAGLGALAAAGGVRGEDAKRQYYGTWAFYEARGARRLDRAQAAPPGGVASRLEGSPAKLRYAWTDPSVLR